MKKAARIGALLCALALMVSSFAGIKASAATEVDEQKEFTYTMKTYKKTFKGTNGSKITFKATYPLITITGDDKLTKTVRTTVYKAFVKKYKDLYTAEYIDATYQAGTRITVTGICADEFDPEAAAIRQTGNILNIRLDYSAQVKGVAYPANEHYFLNVDLRTGRQLTTAKMFKKTSSLRKAVSKCILDYVDALADEASVLGDVYISPEADLAVLAANDEDIKAQLKDYAEKKWNLTDCEFTYDGMFISFDESQHGIHALSELKFFVPNDVFGKYVKAANAQLILPYSMVIIDLPAKSTGTAYIWSEPVFEGTEGALKFVESWTKEEHHPIGMVGYPVTTRCLLSSCGIEGNATVKFNFAPVYAPDSVAETFERSFVITADGFITEENSD